MERRKFIAGLGSLTAAGAAGIGTGAFSSVSADRAVAVTNADDSDALLALDAKASLANSAYADDSGNAISIDLNNDDLNGASTNGAAKGVNSDATTKILEIFEVKNQGTQNVFVYVDPDDITPQSVGDDGSAPIYIDPQASDLPNQTSYVGSALSLTSVWLTDAEIDEHGRDEFPGEAGYYEPEDLTLAPGQSFSFGLYIDHDGTNDWTGTVTLPITASAEHAATNLGSSE